MTIVQQVSGTFAAPSFNVTFPVATTSGNHVVIFILGNTVVAPPAGYAFRKAQVNQMGHYLFDDVAGATTWTFTCTVGVGTWVAFEIEYGSYSSSASSDNDTAGTAYFTPDQLPASGNRIVLASIGFNNASASLNATAWTNGYTEVADLAVASADHPGQAIAKLQQNWNGSAITATTATLSGTASARSAIIAVYASTSGVNELPVVTPSAVQNGIEPGTAITISATATDADGTVVSLTVAQTSGATAALSGSGGSRTFTAPYSHTAQALEFTWTATDNLGGVGTGISKVNVLPQNNWAMMNDGLHPVRFRVRTA